MADGPLVLYALKMTYLALKEVSGAEMPMLP